MTLPNFSKYETARILGARALQISMNAPILITISQEELEKIKYDSLKIAEMELYSGILPISVKRPFPERRDAELKKVVVKKITDEEKAKLEEKEEEEISEDAEIMELANPEDEQETTEESDSEVE